jgi:hypothetical protein
MEVLQECCKTLSEVRFVVLFLYWTTLFYLSVFLFDRILYLGINRPAYYDQIQPQPQDIDATITSMLVRYQDVLQEDNLSNRLKTVQHLGLSSYAMF